MKIIFLKLNSKTTSPYPNSSSQSLILSLIPHPSSYPSSLIISLISNPVINASFKSKNCRERKKGKKKKVKMSGKKKKSHLSISPAPAHSLSLIARRDFCCAPCSACLRTFPPWRKKLMEWIATHPNAQTHKGKSELGDTDLAEKFRQGL